MNIVKARELLSYNEYNRGKAIRLACYNEGYNLDVSCGVAYRIGLADGRALQRATLAKLYSRVAELERELCEERAFHESDERQLARMKPERGSAPSEIDRQPTPGEVQEANENE